MGHSRPLILYFRLFNTVDSKHIFNIKFCHWLDSNHGPLELEATALPTQPRPLPSCNKCLMHQPQEKERDRETFLRSRQNSKVIDSNVISVVCILRSYNSQLKISPNWLLLIIIFFKKWAIPGLFFFYFCLFNTTQLTVNKCAVKFAGVWIWTADLWYRKRPLCQLWHNHSPIILGCVVECGIVNMIAVG